MLMRYEVVSENFKYFQIYSIITYHKVGMSLDIVSHIALNEKVMHTMSCDGSVVGMVNSTVTDIRAIH